MQTNWLRLCKKNRLLGEGFYQLLLVWCEINSFIVF